MCRNIGRLRFWSAAASVLVIVAVVGGWPVYVRPQLDPLRRADAILILGGPDYSRYPFGIDLGLRGWARNLVISNPNGTKDPWLTDFCESPDPPLDVHCFVPNPPTTRGEGQELQILATQHRWQTVIVVTFRPHISRARFILQRCFSGDLVMAAPATTLSPLAWTYEYVYQTVGYLRAVTEADC